MGTHLFGSPCIGRHISVCRYIGRALKIMKIAKIAKIIKTSKIAKVTKIAMNYNIICLIVTSRGEKKSDELCKQVKTIIEARILYHSNSYAYIVLLFAVKYKFMTLWCNTKINSSAYLDSSIQSNIFKVLNLY